MPNEAQLRGDMLRRESAESRSLARDTSFIVRIDSLIKAAITANGSHNYELAHQNLLQIKALLPFLQSAIAFEAQQQNVADAEARGLGAEDQQATQAATQEDVIDRKEIEHLMKMYGVLNKMKDGIMAKAQGGLDDETLYQLLFNSLKSVLQPEIVALNNFIQNEIYAEIKKEKLEGINKRQLQMLIAREKREVALLQENFSNNLHALKAMRMPHSFDDRTLKFCLDKVKNDIALVYDLLRVNKIEDQVIRRGG
ncbi:hypothetical protein HYV81_06310 [Candidatus Woesearchaeota archaeon]|nr:hypothetical protein [Candidatus Woesearchaeota archaeon]